MSMVLQSGSYSRWLPVHVQDVSLTETHPVVARQFLQGQFTVTKTCHKFSSMAIDQAHEPNNASVKCDGGAIGLTPNPELLQLWAVAGPELARIISEFESSLSGNHKNGSGCYLGDQTPAVQSQFNKHVKSLVEVIEDLGHPFVDTGSELYGLDNTKEVASDDVVATVRNIESLGEIQYEEYFTSRLQGEQPISDSIKKNKLPLFSTRPV